ncbi:DUF3592 domain-containing protein [Micromonospora sp. NPDC050397]|uniref:DUF3592 domain-containing protein n=1 Tax=Micromonospora sp. NPDC050397 TaxID=3364279 RepID=UPI00384AD59A
MGQRKWKRRRRAAERDAAEQERGRRHAAIIGLVAVVFGLTWAGITGGYKWHLSSKAERLRAEGVPVNAVVTERRDTTGRGGGTDTVQVHYTYRGEPYSKRILCAGSFGCDRTPPREVVLRVDPAKPAEFVTSNGVTDDSVFFFNSTAGIPFGLSVATAGGALAVLVQWGDRLEARFGRGRRPGSG